MYHLVCVILRFNNAKIKTYYMLTAQPVKIEIIRQLASSIQKVYI